jgi:tRNA U55 pseudouridine synthase TruB
MAKTGPAPVAQNKLDAVGEIYIADLIAMGTTYRAICAEIGVSLGVLCSWIESNPERSQACARAREISGQAHEERAQEEIESASDMFELSKAKELATHLRWRAKAVNPRRYGDKVQNELTGLNGGPIQQSLTVEFVSPPTKAEP